jgi:hypothetical protein
MAARSISATTRPPGDGTTATQYLHPKAEIESGQQERRRSKSSAFDISVESIANSASTASSCAAETAEYECNRCSAAAAGTSAEATGIAEEDHLKDSEEAFAGEPGMSVGYANVLVLHLRLRGD